MAQDLLSNVVMRHLALVLCLLPLFACDGKAENALDPTSDASTEADSTADATADSSAATRVLFELDSSRYATEGFGKSWFGLYVTSAGEVYRYFGDYDTGAPDPCFPSLGFSLSRTEEELTGRNRTELAGTLDKDDVLAHFALVDEARLGSLLVQPGCSDCTLTRYVAYTYDDATSSYSTIPLGADGDLALRNTSPRAEELIAWLRAELEALEPNDLSGPRQCAFEAASCGDALCPGLDACTDGTVPMSPDGQGCMQECGAASRCDSVSDCTVCSAAGASCVTDQDGLFHCVDSVPGCDGELACDCGGAELCAGGAGYCQGTTDEGFRCAAP